MAKRGTAAELGSQSQRQAQYSLKQLQALGLGFRHIQWDGVYVPVVVFVSIYNTHGCCP